MIPYVIDEAFIGEATVYLHTMSADSFGPYAWCAHIVHRKGVTEIGGASDTDHDTRLTIVGLIEALNSIKKPSIVKLVCSNYEYAVKYGLERLDPSMEAKLRKRKVANLDLFPALRSAVGRHLLVKGVEVHRDDRDEEHLRTIEGAKRLLAEFKESDLQLFQPIIAPVDGLSVDAAVPW